MHHPSNTDHDRLTVRHETESTMKEMRPYLNIRPQAVDDGVKVRHTPDNSGWAYTLDIGVGNYLFINPDGLNTLLVDVATVLHDAGGLSMESAERLQYLAQSVLIDNEPVIDLPPSIPAPGKPQSVIYVRPEA